MATVRLGTGTVNSIFYAIFEDTDAVTQLDLYTFSDGGGPPADADAGTEGTLVASIPISYMYGGTSGTAYLSGGALAGAEGSVGYGRLANATRTHRIQGSAGTSITADFIISNGETIVVSDPVSFVCNIVQPAIIE